MSITFTSGVNIIRRTTTLGTIDNPATSAVQLYNNGQTTNGWYYIQTGTMTSSMQVYCNQTDNGGGWMLVAYNPSGSNASFVGYPYPNMFSGSAGSFTKQIADTEKLWYSATGSAQCNSVMRMASTASVQPHLASCSIAHSVVYSNPNALDLATGSGTYTLKLSAALTGSWSAIKGYTLMTASSYPVMAPCDWLYDAANWWTVAGPTNVYPDAPYGRSGNALGTGGWTNRLNNTIYGLANVSTTGNSITSNFNTLAVYIK